MWDLLIVPQKPVAASRCVGCWREFLFCILCLVSILPQIARERMKLHLIHGDTMLFGCSLFSANISPSLLKNVLVHLLIPPAIVNTRGVKDACSTFFFFFFFMNGNTERAQCALSLVCIPQEMGERQ